jgi:hypothetical protein
MARRSDIFKLLRASREGRRVLQVAYRGKEDRIAVERDIVVGSARSARAATPFWRRGRRPLRKRREIEPTVMKTDRTHGLGSAMNAVALLRRSTNMQDKSIEEQCQFITGWARANGYTIFAEHVDDAISGDRSGFPRLMQELDSPARPWKLILGSDRARFTL